MEHRGGKEGGDGRQALNAGPAKSTASSRGGAFESNPVFILLEEIGSPVLVFDSEWNLSYANQKAHRLINLNQSDQVADNITLIKPARFKTNDNWLDFLRAELEAAGFVHDRCRLADIELNCEIKLLNLNHLFMDNLLVKLRPVKQTTGEARPDKGGQREKTKAEVEDSDRRYRLAMNAANEAFFEYDLVEERVIFGGRLAKALGYKKDNTVVKLPELDEVIHPDDRRRNRKALNDHLSGRSEHYQAEFRIRNRDGAWLWVMSRGKVVSKNHKGEPLRVAATITDIHIRKNTERALWESKERYRTLVESMSEGLIEMDMSGNILYANRFCEVLIGMPREEALGVSIIDVLEPYLDDETKKTVQRQLALRKQGVVEDYEVEIRRKPGHAVWLRISPRIILDEAGDPKSVVAMVTDLTDRKRAEETLVQMAAGVAHNFNNILMAMTSNVQAAKSALKRMGVSSGGDVEGYLRNAVNSALSGKSMVKRLHSYVAPQQERLLPARPVDVCQLVDTAIEIVSSSFSEKEAALLNLYNHTRKGLTAMGDTGELVEVFVNLIKNAVEAMRTGGALNIRGGRDNRMLILEFCDSGHGMESETLSRVFEPFFTTKGSTGQGLGLASSRGIIRSLGGDITAWSRPGVGTTMKVVIPEAEPGKGPEALDIGLSFNTGISLDVLLVEDEALVAMGIQAVLEDAGHRVTWVRGVAEAITCLEENPPSLLVCDFGLMDGTAWDVAGHLPENGDDGRIPWLILTGWSKGQLPLKQPQGVRPPQKVIQKPVDKQVLLRAVAEAGKKD